MKNQEPSEQLLSDIFSDAISPAFRSALLSETLRLARRKRRARSVVKGVTATVAIGIMAILGGRFRTLTPGLAVPSTANFHLVETQPLARSYIVTTRPFAANCVIETVAFSGQVQTEKTHLLFRLIDDRELLALAGAGRAALIRVGPEAQELIFVKPDDANEFQVR